MLIIALVLALIGLIALVFAVVTSNELVAWVCIIASVVGVILLIVDAIRERQHHEAGGEEDEAVQEAPEAEDAENGDEEHAYVDYPDEAPEESEQETRRAQTAAPAEHANDESTK